VPCRVKGSASARLELPGGVRLELLDLEVVLCVGLEFIHLCVVAARARVPWPARNPGFYRRGLSCACSGGFPGVTLTLACAAAGIPSEEAKDFSFCHMNSFHFDTLCHMNSIRQDATTPLHMAASDGRTVIANLLVNSGAVLGAQNKVRNLKLSAAKLCENARGPQEEPPVGLKTATPLPPCSQNGKTALDIAKAKGYLAVVEVLERASPKQVT
jgi:hypothetical protein